MISIFKGNSQPPKTDGNKNFTDLPEIQQKDFVETPAPLLGAAI